MPKKSIFLTLMISIVAVFTTYKLFLESEPPRPYPPEEMFVLTDYKNSIDLQNKLEQIVKKYPSFKDVDAIIRRDNPEIRYSYEQSKLHSIHGYFVYTRGWGTIFRTVYILRFWVDNDVDIIKYNATKGKVL